MAIALGGFADSTARRRSAGQGLLPGRGHLRAAIRPSADPPHPGSAPASLPEDTGEPGTQAFAAAPGGLAAAGPAPPGEDPPPREQHRPAPAIDSRLLRKSFAQLEPQSDKAMGYFYGSLFLRNPEFRAMFPLAMDGQRRRLLDGLARCVWGADQHQELTGYLRDLARDHRKFGVTEKHYRAFCDALLASLESSSPGWGEETLAAWRALLDHVATVMAGAASAAAGEPAWWLGEIVRHERRRPDLAVLTIRPDGAEPLRYRAGQYISIQLPQWPRVWRCYSAANAPRPDGTLDLHVRAVPGGRISSFLVEQAAPGDSLVIGPARGSMTLPAATGPGSILCVAGGTGLAPIKALAEELAAQRAEAGAGTPEIRLLAGARHADDLYDLPDLQRLAAACPSLTVVPVVAPAGAAARGGLPAAAAGQLTPDTGDIFISGPGGMVRATVRQLSALAPAARIHADTAGPWRADRRQRQRAGREDGGRDTGGEGEPPTATSAQRGAEGHSPAGEEDEEAAGGCPKLRPAASGRRRAAAGLAPACPVQAG